MQVRSSAWFVTLGFALADGLSAWDSSVGTCLS
jgi:hypothetical protein